MSTTKTKKRASKVKFSRIPLLILVVLLQLALIITIFLLLLNTNLEWLTILIDTCLIIAEAVIFLVILNRDDAPDFKIPWFCVMMFLPLLGILCFAFFANHGVPKRFAEFEKKFSKQQAPFYYVTEEATKEFASEVEKYACVNGYLNKISYLRGYKGNKVTYYENGEKFFPDFIKCLKEAKKFIFMEFFIIDHGKEWSLIHDVLKQKVKEGVEVRLMYDDFGCAATLGKKYIAELQAEGIQAVLFNRFIPLLNGLFNNRDHRKIAIIDHKYGFTGGMNLADEYANDIVRFGYWKDSMIKIEGPAIINLMQMFFGTYDVNTGVISDYKKYLDYDFKEKGDTFVYPFGDGPKPFYDDMVGEETFINMMAAARKSIYISTPYLIPTFALEKAILQAAKNGIEVNLIVPGIPDKKAVYLLAKSKFTKYIQAGVNVYTYTPGFNHQKCIVIDDEFAFVGTINFDYRSLVHHFECGALLYGGDVIKEVSDDLKQMVKDSQKVPQTFKLHWFKRLICSVMNMFAALL